MVKKLYNDAIAKIVEDNGGCPPVRLSNLPNYRTSKSTILKKIPRKHPMQMVPTIPPHMKQESTGEDFDASKVSAGYLNDKK